MLTVVKNQMRVCALSVKYNIMREMVNKVTFLTNVGFMVLNNATFLVQWMILLRMRGDVGGYTMREIMLLWGFMAASFGLFAYFVRARLFLVGSDHQGEAGLFSGTAEECARQRADLGHRLLGNRRFPVRDGAGVCL